MTTISKQSAAEFFGGSQISLAKAIGISAAAISKWPDQLTERQTNEVLGAALRRGVIDQAEVDRLNAKASNERTAADSKLIPLR